VSEYLPAPQAGQEAAIALFDALPTGHCWHAPGIERAVPSEKKPTPHAVHA